jgi:methylglutaconyl-CoA hydratase
MGTPVERVHEGGVARIRLNQPERRNVLSREMCGALSSALKEDSGDAQTGAILLESTGPVFCGGGDAGEPDVTQLEELLHVSANLLKPLVAAVQGPAMGPGVALLANAVVVVAAQGATFAMDEIRRGAFPYLSYVPLARAIGTRRALELCISGRVFTVPDAIAWGLIQHTAPAFEFDDRAFAIAEQLAGAGAAVEAGIEFARRIRADDPATRGLAIEHSVQTLGTLNIST